MSLKGLFNARWPGVALFDLDGTLVDSAPDLAAAVDQMLEHLGRSPAGLDKVRTWVGNGALRRRRPGSPETSHQCFNLRVLLFLSGLSSP